MGSGSKNEPFEAYEGNPGVYRPCGGVAVDGGCVVEIAEGQVGGMGFYGEEGAEVVADFGVSFDAQGVAAAGGRHRRPGRSAADLGVQLVGNDVARHVQGAASHPVAQVGDVGDGCHEAVDHIAMREEQVPAVADEDGGGASPGIAGHDAGVPAVVEPVAVTGGKQEVERDGVVGRLSVAVSGAQVGTEAADIGRFAPTAGGFAALLHRAEVVVHEAGEEPGIEHKVLVAAEESAEPKHVGAIGVAAEREAERAVVEGEVAGQALSEYADAAFARGAVAHPVQGAAGVPLLGQVLLEGELGERHVVVELHVVFVQLVKAGFDFGVVGLAAHTDARAVGAPIGQAVAGGGHFVEHRAVEVVGRIEQALEADVDRPVFGRHPFHFQVLGLQVHLVGRDGGAEVAACTIGHVANGPVDLKRGAEGGLSVENFRLVNKKRQGALFGVPAGDAVGGGGGVGPKKAADDLAFQKVVRRVPVGTHALGVEITVHLKFFVGLVGQRFVEATESPGARVILPHKQYR